MSAGVAAGLGEVLSPSQVNTFLNCPAKWYFRYLVGLREPATGSLALGTAFHATVAANFRQKVSTHRDTPIDELRVLLGDEVVMAIADAELREDEDASELAAIGDAMLAVYMKEAAPSISPVAVELEVEGEIAGVKARGFVDVLDAEGRIIDCKTASRRPSGVSAEHALQLTTYAMITSGASGVCRLDTLTKTKTVQLVQQSHEVRQEERTLAEHLFPMVQDSIRDGVYLPRRNSTLCSRRYCGYWRECEREFGGRVNG